ncbi:hypothetical protein HK105_200184 [Polyrhizophydium stewartii]|uniref:Cytochrome P450 n=1 Tax=Polyrhizophydium stewartii TaxID=2732419 RepID=A0ABR4NKR1_9FUNG|nr:hypothetical protein HK105_001865 [Polyrhizophydium stewartii]
MPATISALIPQRAAPGLLARLLALLAGRPRVSTALLLLALVLVRNRHTALGSYPRMSKSYIRHPGSVPVLGVIPWAISNYDRLHDAMTDAFRQVGFKTVVITAPFSPPRFIVSDPRCIEYVLRTNFDNFVKGKFFDDRLHDILGTGIFNADGEHWRVLRKTAANIFTTRGFRMFVETIFADEMKLLVAKLDETAVAGQAIDMKDLFFRFTLDGFGMIGFGYPLHCMSRGSVPFAAAFDRMQTYLAYRVTSPSWWIEERIKASARSKFLADKRLIREFAQTIIDQRRAETAEKREARSDLLTLLMNVSADDSGRKYTDDELRDHVLNFLIAGRDTTAQVLSWTVYYLSLHPEARKKLMAEIDATLGDATYPTYEQVKGMKYANAVFSEALRLSPPVARNGKTAIEACTLPDGTFVPKGMTVGWFTYSMSRNPAVWGADAEAFRPERWIEERIRTQYENTSFNAGPRICLGKALAELEGVYVLVSMFRHFDVVAVDPSKITYANSLTLPIKGELDCRITKRR